MFQGSGFALEIPEGCADATVYTFLLPTEAQFTPYVTIKFERVGDDADLESYIAKQHEALADSVEDFLLIKKVSGKRGGWDAALATMEWGPPDCRVRQKQAFFLVPGKVAKVYSLTGIDLVSNFGKSEPLFDTIFKNFKPNDIQIIDA